MRAGWTQKKLGDICEVLDSKRKPITKSARVAGMIPYYGATGIQDYVKDFIFDGRFLLVGEDGAKWGQDDNSAYIIEGKSWVNNHVHILRVHDDALDSFVRYFLNRKDLTPFITGAVVPKLTQAALVSIPIPIPPLSEQKTIVAEIDLLSDLLEKQKTQLKEYDTLARSIFYDMFGDPEENKRGWDVKEMGDLYDIGSSKRVFESEWKDSGVPFYRAREIVRLSKNEAIESPIFISEDLYIQYSQKFGVPSAGDIMVTAVGTLGVSYIVQTKDRFYFKDGNILWFRSRGLCESRFIKDQYATAFVVNQIQGNANAAVVGTYTIMNAKKTRVVVPPLSLQREYVERVRAIDNQKETINKAIKETQTLFNFTMDKYFG